MFQLCLVGWYFTPSLLNSLRDLPQVHLVAHRHHPAMLDFDYTLRPNVGLEWEAYHFFLMHVWDGRSRVIFSHDDAEVDDSAAFRRYLDGLATSPAAYTGADSARLFSLDAACLEKISQAGGFWYDVTNRGRTRRRWAANRGVRAFRKQKRQLGIPRFVQVQPEGVRLGFRGVISSPGRYPGRLTQAS